MILQIIYFNKYIGVSRHSLSSGEFVTASDVGSMFIYAIICDYYEMAIGYYKT